MEEQTPSGKLGWELMRQPARSIGVFAAAAVLVVGAFLIVYDRVRADPDGGVTAQAAGTTALRETGLARTCTSTWLRVPSPEIRQGSLESVDALTSSYAWAVGGVVHLGGDTGGEVVSGSPVVLHWNGRQWSVAARPRMRGVLTDVAATSRVDAWAVGYVPPSSAPLVLRWAGRRWSRLRVPTSVQATKAVAALPAGDVWIAGTTYVSFSPVGQVSHWDGRRWTRVLTRRDAVFEDIAATSEHDIWVVGSTGADMPKALLLHWDGSRWTPFLRGPSPGNDSAWLLSVDARETADVWAGGGEHAEELSPPAIAPFLLHWDGERWSRANLLDPGETELDGIAAISAGEAFAVSSNSWSYYEQGGSGYAVWRRSGGRWHGRDLPYGWELYDIGAAPARPGAKRVVWAVGQVGSGIEDYATRTLPLICQLRR